MHEEIITTATTMHWEIMTTAHKPYYHLSAMKSSRFVLIIDRAEVRQTEGNAWPAAAVPCTSSKTPRERRKASESLFLLYPDAAKCRRRMTEALPLSHAEFIVAFLAAARHERMMRGHCW